MPFQPKSKVKVNPRLLVQQVGNETLVVDPSTQRVHNLNPATARVFELCRQSDLTTMEIVSALKNSLPTTTEENAEAIVLEALSEMQAKDVVFSEFEFERSPSRRRALTLAGLLLPALISATLIQPAAAASANPSCTVNMKAGQCMPIGTTDPDQCCALGLIGSVQIEFSDPIPGVCAGGSFVSGMGSPNTIDCAINTGASGVVRCVALF